MHRPVDGYCKGGGGDNHRIGKGDAEKTGALRLKVVLGVIVRQGRLPATCLASILRISGETTAIKVLQEFPNPIRHFSMCSRQDIKIS
jgi:hypothetical protein